MDTKKILRANSLNSLATNVNIEQNLKFEQEVVQPFIDDAAAMCILAAQAGQYHWVSNYESIEVDKEILFKRLVNDAFKNYGYKVNFYARHYENATEIAVGLNW